MTDLQRFGTRPLSVRIHLRTFDVTPAVVRRPPAERFEFLRHRSDKQLRLLQRAAGADQWRIATFGGHGIPVEIVARMPAANVRNIARCAGVSRIEVRSKVIRSRSRLDASPSWFCVRERVAVQVESQRRGLQTVEDRFVLVRAETEAAARRRALKEARAYARPYLNSSGLLVRWHVEAIVSVDYVLDFGQRPSGTEVFSELRTRRMRKTHIWHPRTSKLGWLTAACSRRRMVQAFGSAAAEAGR